MQRSFRQEIQIEPVLDVAQRAEVARLASLIWRECYAGIVPPEQIDFMLKSFQSEQAIAEQILQGYRYFQLSRGVEIFGYFAIQPQPEGRLFLSKIYLMAGERRKGYGRKMMTFIEGWAGREGYSEVTLTVNKKNNGAIRVYESMGFRIVESLVQDIGEGFVMDDYRMTRLL